MSARRAVEADAEGYDLDGALGSLLGRVDRGTNLLLSAPAMTGKRDLLMEAIAGGHRHGEHGIVVTTRDTPTQVVQRYRSTVHDVSDRPLYIVDCSDLDDPDPPSPGRVIETTTPDDLTGIGIGFVKSNRAIGPAAADGVRVGVASASTIVQYAGLDRAFNFLHTVTGRLSTTGYLSIWTLDPTVHDTRTVNTVTAAFDGVVEIRETEDGGRRGRVKGLPGVPRGWQQID